MKYCLLITLLIAGCVDVKEFEGKSFYIRSIQSSKKDGRCKYQIVSNDIFSPNIILFDNCNKWCVGDKVHFVKD